MRIGEFAKGHGVTIDTVRHYMDIELIMPEKRGGHYDFDGVCSRDMEELLWYKAAGFSLSEIQRVFIIRRFTGIKSREDAEYVRNLLLLKREELLKERSKLEAMLHEIENRVLNTKIENGAERRIGIPLSFLPHLVCPDCGVHLTLKKGEIENSAIMEGNLDCSCGFSCEVKSGILIVKDKVKIRPWFEELDKWDYIENTAPEFMNFMYKGQEWITKRAILNDLSGKIILEPGIGFGTFITGFDSYLPVDSIYIGVDDNLEALRYTKTNLEKNATKGNFVFICTDLKYVPVKVGLVDMVLDFIGTSEYSFRCPSFLTDVLSPMLKEGGWWVGAGFCFKQGSKSLMRLREENRRFFYLDNVKKGFEKSFKLLQWEMLGFAERAGEYEPFFQDGDRVNMIGYYGEKTSG